MAEAVISLPVSKKLTAGVEPLLVNVDQLSVPEFPPFDKSDLVKKLLKTTPFTKTPENFMTVAVDRIGERLVKEAAHLSREKSIQNLLLAQVWEEFSEQGIANIQEQADALDPRYLPGTNYDDVLLLTAFGGTYQREKQGRTLLDETRTRVKTAFCKARVEIETVPFELDVIEMSNEFSQLLQAKQRHELNGQGLARYYELRDALEKETRLQTIVGEEVVKVRSAEDTVGALERIWRAGGADELEILDKLLIEEPALVNDADLTSDLNHRRQQVFLERGQPKLGIQGRLLGTAVRIEAAWQRLIANNRLTGLAESRNYSKLNPKFEKVLEKVVRGEPSEKRARNRLSRATRAMVSLSMGLAGAQGYQALPQSVQELLTPFGITQFVRGLISTAPANAIDTGVSEDELNNIFGTPTATAEGFADTAGPAATQAPAEPTEPTATPEPQIEAHNLFEFLFGSMYEQYFLTARQARFAAMDEAQKADFLATIGGEANLDNHRITLALLGKDSGGIHKDEFTKAGHADQIHIISLDLKTGNIVDVTINRDLRVPELASGLPGDENTINTGTWLDQKELAKGNYVIYDREQVIRPMFEHAVGIPLDGILEVNLDGFVQIVDTMFPGKVTVTIGPGEGFYVDPNEGYNSDLSIAGQTFTEGETYQLSGQQLLDFARVRSGVSGGTFAREARGSSVLEFMLKQLLQEVKGHPENLPQMINSIIPIVESLEESPTEDIRFFSDVEMNETKVNFNQLARYYLLILNKAMTDPKQLASMTKLMVASIDDLQSLGIKRINLSETPLVDPVTGETVVLEHMPGDYKYVIAGEGQDALDPERALEYWLPFRQLVQNVLGVTNYQPPLSPP